MCVLDFFSLLLSVLIMLFSVSNFLLMLIFVEWYFGIEGKEWGVYLGIIDKGLECGFRRNIFFVVINYYFK